MKKRETWKRCCHSASARGERYWTERDGFCFCLPGHNTAAWIQNAPYMSGLYSTNRCDNQLTSMTYSTFTLGSWGEVKHQCSKIQDLGDLIKWSDLPSKSDYLSPVLPPQKRQWTATSFQMRSSNWFSLFDMRQKLATNWFAGVSLNQNETATADNQ